MAILSRGRFSIMRPYRVGDSWLRYLLTEPRDAAFFWRGRFMCRVLRRHNHTCDGRPDHRKTVPNVGQQVDDAMRGNIVFYDWDERVENRIRRLERPWWRRLL